MPYLIPPRMASVTADRCMILWAHQIKQDARAPHDLLGFCDQVAEPGKHQLLMRLLRCAMTDGKAAARQAGVEQTHGDCPGEVAGAKQANARILEEPECLFEWHRRGAG